MMGDNHKQFYKVAVLFFICGLFFLAHPVQAATIYSNSSTGNDTTGAGTVGNPYKTFHKAYTSSSANDTINLTGTFSWTDTDETGDSSASAVGYTLGKNLTITGQSAQTTIIQANASANTADRRVFTISTGINVTFQNLTIRNGYITTTSNSGAGINAGNGNLTIQDCIIKANNGSGTNVSGGVFSSGNVTITNSSFLNNTGTYVGGLYSSGSAKNTIVTNSTFYGNTGSVGTMYIYTGTLTMTNSMSTQGGPIEIQGNANQYFENNIMLDNTGTDLYYYNFFGTVTDNGYNILGAEGGSGSTSTNWFTNGVNGTIELTTSTTLANEGIGTVVSENGAANTTLTLPLLGGSAAINAGGTTANNGVSVPSTDQRGRSRVGATDIGPFEYQGGADEIDPYIVSASKSSDDTYVDITFSEGVYTDSGHSTGLAPADFTVTFAANGGGASAVSISSITKTDNGTITGGETTVRARLSITGTSNGVETFYFSPATTTSIYDVAGNALSTSQNTSTLTLTGAYHYYVDPLGTDDGSHGTTSGSGAYQTIQYAITNVPNPTTAPIVIHISGDTYTTNNTVITITRSFTNLTLQGAGATSTIIQPAADPASATVGNFSSTSGTNTITLKNMTVRYGRGSTSGSGINQNNGSLTLTNMNFDDNDSTSTYGGIALSGGATLVMTNSTLSNSTASGASSKGGITFPSTAVITNCTFYNNTGSHTGSIYLSSSTRLTFINNTVYKGGGTSFGNFMADNGSITYMRNNIFADIDQGSTNVYRGTSATINNGGYNLVESSSGITFNATGDLAGNQTNLNISSTLASNSTENGTQTLALSSNSVAVNAGSSSAYNSVSIPTTDQRNATRSGTVDMGAYEYNGTIGAPVVSTVYPVDDATDIALNSNLILTFSEIVNVGTGNITIKKTSDNSTIETINVTSGQVTGGGTTTITINPSTNLASGTAYYIQIDATAFQDVSANTYAGISDTTSWSFTTGSAPTITSISSDKTNGTYGVGTVIDIDVTFSQAVTSTGNVTVTLETGVTDETCTFAVSNATTGTCNYTVQAGDTTADLDASISGTIADTSGNALTNYTPATSLATNKALVIDTVTQTPTLNTPSTGTTNSMHLSYSLPETASSVYVTFTNGSAQTSTFAMSTASSVDITFSPTLTNAAVIAAHPTTVTGISSAFSTVLPDGTYTATLSYQDALGNTVASASASNIVIDTTTQAPTLTTPATGTTNSIRLHYALPETPFSNSVQVIFTNSLSDTSTFTMSAGTSVDFTFSPTSTNAAVLGANSSYITNISSAFSTVLPDDTYSVELQYQDSIGNTVASVTTSGVVIDTTAPSAPTSFVAQVSGVNVSLSWANPLTDFSSVTIKRRVDTYPTSISDPAATTVRSGYTGTSQSNNGLSEGNYYYSIFTVDAADNVSSAAQAFVTIDITPPTAPTGFTAEQSGSAINLSWANPSSDFASVTLMRKTGSYPTSTSDGTTVTSGFTGTNRSETGLSDNTYYYSIFALDAAGNVSVAAQATATLDTVTQTPNLITPTTGRSNTLHLSYTLPETPTTGSVKVVFTNAQAQTSTFTMGNSTTVDFTFDPTATNAVVSAAHIATISSISSNFSTVLPDNVYSVALQYRDVLGNPVVSTTTTGVIIDAVTGVTVSTPIVFATENNIIDFFGVVLESQPTANVTINITTDHGYITPASTQLVFTSSNWDTMQSVMVSAVNDSIANGTQTDTIRFSSSSSDSIYNAATIARIAATIIDDDLPGVTVSVISGNTTEAGGAATFTVVLNSQPTTDVIIPVVSSDTTEGTVSAASLIFTAANWNTVQTVTATGVDDTEDDGDMAYSVVLGAATSTDTNYSDTNPTDVTLINTDNDDPVTTTTTEPDITTDTTTNTSPTLIVDSSKADATLTIVHEDGQTDVFQPFTGKTDFLYAIDPDQDAVFATNGKLVRIFVAGVKVDQVKVNKKKTASKFYRLAATTLSDGTSSVVLLTTSKRAAKISVLQVDQNNTVTHRSAARVTIQKRNLIKLKVKKHNKVKVTIGKGKLATHHLWKVQANGDLK